jgi:hypothetical protein
MMASPLRWTNEPMKAPSVSLQGLQRVDEVADV